MGDSRLKKLSKKARQKIVGFLRQGITPEKLAQTMAFGLCLGTIPLLGATSILCATVALLFKLNMPAIQAVNYIVYPLQLVLFIPFLKIGTSLFSANNFILSLNQITQMLAQHPFQTIADLFFINLYGLLLWLLITPLVFLITYFLSRKLFFRVQNRMDKNRVTPLPYSQIDGDS